MREKGGRDGRLGSESPSGELTVPDSRYFFIHYMPGTKGLVKIYFLRVFFFFLTRFTNELQMPQSTGAGEKQEAPFPGVIAGC